MRTGSTAALAEKLAMNGVSFFEHRRSDIHRSSCLKLSLFLELVWAAFKAIGVNQCAYATQPFGCRNESVKGYMSIGYKQFRWLPDNPLFGIHKFCFYTQMPLVTSINTTTRRVFDYISVMVKRISCWLSYMKVMVRILLAPIKFPIW